MDAEELYRYMADFARDVLGWSPDADLGSAGEYLEAFCNEVTAEDAHQSSADDPNASWQCFTPEANAVMQRLWEKLHDDVIDHKIIRTELDREVSTRVNAVAQFYRGQGVLDTEPQTELMVRLNALCDRVGWVRTDRFNW